MKICCFLFDDDDDDGHGHNVGTIVTNDIVYYHALLNYPRAERKPSIKPLGRRVLENLTVFGRGNEH